MAYIDTAFTRALLSSGVELVRKHFPTVKTRKDAWVYHFNSDHWEFHGPNGFYWHGSASDAYEARYKGWMAWLEKQGVDLSAIEDAA